jgi:hypothetical protein
MALWQQASRWVVVSYGAKMEYKATEIALRPELNKKAGPGN